MIDGMQVTVTAATPTAVTALLPGPLPSGSYRLTMARGPAAVDVGHFDLTIGAAGPQGPAGATGDKGDPGTPADLSLVAKLFEPNVFAATAPNIFNGTSTFTAPAGFSAPASFSAGLSAGSTTGAGGTFWSATGNGIFASAATGTGIFAIADATSGPAHGVQAVTRSLDASGLWGSSPGIGVFGVSTSRDCTSDPGCNGLIGRSDATSGPAWGIQGFAEHSVAVNPGDRGGIGVLGRAGWIGGMFQVTSRSNSNILVGTVQDGPWPASPTTVFRVDAAGDVYANAYRDLAGNLLPAGDVTGVAAGSGLTGGGAAGDVSLALDTAYTDSRYAPASHGHTVGQITGAATLGANSFTGNQSIAGNLTAQAGNFQAQVAARSTLSGTPAVRGDSFANASTGVFGSAENGQGVFGSVVLGAGVNGMASGNQFGNVGVLGQIMANSGPGIGVRGVTNSPAGTAIEASAGATTGATTGMRAFVRSGDGVAGDFLNTGAGDLLRGRSGSAGATLFRVDGTGTVHATAYKDANGNTIGGGISGYSQDGNGSSSGAAPGQLHQFAYTCPVPKKVLGGGCKDTGGQLTLVSSGPKLDGSGWECVFRNDEAVAANTFIQAFGICANVQ